MRRGRRFPTITPVASESPTRQAADHPLSRTLQRNTCAGASLPVYAVLQCLAGGEFRALGGGDFDWLTGAGVAAFAGRAFDHLEIAEAGDLDLTPLAQRGGNSIEGGVDRARRNGARQARLLGDDGDEFVLGHGGGSFPLKASIGAMAWEGGAFAGIASDCKTILP